MTTETIKISDLTPYSGNARKHGTEDVGAIAKSIEAFGFRDPVGVWGPNNIIVEGHGRVLAAKQLGLTEVPCIRLDDMTDEQRRAYGLAHNKTAELSTWDAELLPLEIEDLPTYDMTAFGFNLGAMGDAWFEMRERMEAGQDGNEEYNEFLQKFEIQKTTDDCYTPDKVYEAVADWVSKEYKVPRSKMIRPFYPGGGGGVPERSIPEGLRRGRQPAVFDPVGDREVLRREGDPLFPVRSVADFIQCRGF